MGNPFQQPNIFCIEISAEVYHVYIQKCDFCVKNDGGQDNGP